MYRSFFSATISGFVQKEIDQKSLRNANRLPMKTPAGFSKSEGSSYPVLRVLEGKSEIE